MKIRACAVVGILPLILLPGRVLAQLPSPAGEPVAFLSQPPNFPSRLAVYRGQLQASALGNSQPRPLKAAGTGQALPEAIKGQVLPKAINGQTSPETISILASPTAKNGPASPASITRPSPRDSSIKAAFALLDSLFRRPKFLYIAVGPDIPADIQPIIARMNNAIAANQAWFQQYRNRYPNQQLPYDEHFGVTPSQYYSVLHLQTIPPPLVPIDSQTVAVIKEGSLIHLQCGGTGEEHLLNYLYIDPVHRVLEYGGDTIPFAGPASAGPNSPYGQWTGYAWQLERIQSLPAPVDPLLPADTQNASDQKLISARIVEVNIGIPADGSPRTFIRIQYRNVQAGIATGNMELLGYIE